VTSQAFRRNFIYAELLRNPKASLAEVKDQPITTIYSLAITQRVPAY